MGFKSFMINNGQMCYLCGKIVWFGGVVHNTRLVHQQCGAEATKREALVLAANLMGSQDKPKRKGKVPYRPPDGYACDGCDNYDPVNGCWMNVRNVLTCMHDTRDICDFCGMHYDVCECNSNGDDDDG